MAEVSILTPNGFQNFGSALGLPPLRVLLVHSRARWYGNRQVAPFVPPIPMRPIYQAPSLVSDAAKQPSSANPSAGGGATGANRFGARPQPATTTDRSVFRGQTGAGNVPLKPFNASNISAIRPAKASRDEPAVGARGVAVSHAGATDQENLKPMQRWKLAVERHNASIGVRTENEEPAAREREGADRRVEAPPSFAEARRRFGQLAGNAAAAPAEQPPVAPVVNRAVPPPSPPPPSAAEATATNTIGGGKGEEMFRRRFQAIEGVTSTSTVSSSALSPPPPPPPQEVNRPAPFQRLQPPPPQWPPRAAPVAPTQPVTAPPPAMPAPPPAVEPVAPAVASEATTSASLPPLEPKSATVAQAEAATAAPGQAPVERKRHSGKPPPLPSKHRANTTQSSSALTDDDDDDGEEQEEEEETLDRHDPRAMPAARALASPLARSSRGYYVPAVPRTPAQVAEIRMELRKARREHRILLEKLATIEEEREFVRSEKASLQVERESLYRDRDELAAKVEALRAVLSHGGRQAQQMLRPGTTDADDSVEYLRARSAAVALGITPPPKPKHYRRYRMSTGSKAVRTSLRDFGHRFGRWWRNLFIVDRCAMSDEEEEEEEMGRPRRGGKRAMGRSAISRREPRRSRQRRPSADGTSMSTASSRARSSRSHKDSSGAAAAAAKLAQLESQLHSLVGRLQSMDTLDGESENDGDDDHSLDGPVIRRAQPRGISRPIRRDDQRSRDSKASRGHTAATAGGGGGRRPVRRAAPARRLRPDSDDDEDDDEDEDGYDGAVLYPGAD